jgi:hypothetical protein
MLLIAPGQDHDVTCAEARLDGLDIRLVDTLCVGIDLEDHTQNLEAAELAQQISDVRSLC